MKPEDLLKVWDAPDNTKLTANQYSIRLPIHVAARISALCEMFPRRTRTEITSHLLSTALDQVEAGFPFVQGQLLGFADDEGKPAFEDDGPRPRFRSLTEKFMQELEGEQAREAMTGSRPLPVKTKKRKGQK